MTIKIRQLDQSKVVHAAFGAYLLSYALPAVVIANDVIWGCFAAFLSFKGMVERGLESGQMPACFLGAFANVLMVSGYVAFNLRRYSKKGRPSYLLAPRLTLGATVCALGAIIFLATGNESFAPLPGFFVWIGSMVIMYLWMPEKRIFTCDGESVP